jgi:hypothetical protein
MTLEFVVNSVPVEPLEFVVYDETGFSKRSLGAYTGAQVVITGPDGLQRVGGTASITDAAGGKVTFSWPETSLFEVPGDYHVQLKLMNGSAADYTTTKRIVVKGLGV